MIAHLNNRMVTVHERQKPFFDNWANGSLPLVLGTKELHGLCD